MINTIQENEIFNLADKVDYQDGAFHPLVIDSNDRGEHVLMAVDKGVLIPEHKAPSDLIFQALEGEAVLHVGGKDLGVRIFFWTILVVLTLSLSFLCILLDSCRPR